MCTNSSSLAKDANAPVPPAELKKVLYSPSSYQRKAVDEDPILDLHVLNRAMHRLPDQDVDAEARSDMYSLIGFIYCDITVG